MNILKRKRYDFNNVAFSYLNLTECNKLSDMNRDEIRDLLREINRTPFQLRSKIDLSEKVTFGLEIEFENAVYEHVNKDLAHLFRMRGTDAWNLKVDSTVCLGDRGGEIITPILTDSMENWSKLGIVCHMLQSLEAQADDLCGGHIHIGSTILEKNLNYYSNMLKLWTIYEKIIYHFAYGDKNVARKGILTYAPPIGPSFYNSVDAVAELSDIEEIKLFLRCGKHLGINFNNVKINDSAQKNTIEFRCPNGTINPIVWQNNVNFFTKFLLYCASCKYDDELVNHKLKAYADCDNAEFITLSNNVYLGEALELSDLIFTNNLDKIYFLKQYLKSSTSIRNQRKLIKR